MFAKNYKKSSKVMMISGDYPSITKQIISSGFDHFFIDNSWDLENQIINGINENNQLFCFSIVQYVDGLLIDLDLIKNKRKFPNILLIADGTQYFGTKFLKAVNLKLML